MCVHFFDVMCRSTHGRVRTTRIWQIGRFMRALFGVVVPGPFCRAMAIGPAVVLRVGCGFRPSTRCQVAYVHMHRFVSIHLHFPSEISNGFEVRRPIASAAVAANSAWENHSDSGLLHANHILSELRQRMYEIVQPI